MRGRGALALALAAGLALGWLAHGEREGPRLIAHDCAGAGGDVWASEESDFPTPCAQIERWQ